MIEMENISKTYRINGVKKVIAREISFKFPRGESVALLGANGAGKSTMLKLIAGTVAPDKGKIRRHGSVSWPVGFAGSFHGDLTGAQNVKFVARIYGVDTDEMTDFTQEFSQLGAHFHLPVRTYSSGMKARLAFAMSMAVKFEMYLIDEITAVGDGGFRRRSEDMLCARLEDSGAIFVSHSLDQMRRLCKSGVVLQNGRFFYYARVQKAIEHYDYLMQGVLPPWMH